MSRQAILVPVLALVLAIALWWMLLMSPQREQVTAFESDLAAVEAQGVALQSRITTLESMRGRAAQMESNIAALRSVVPTSDEIESALRQMQAAADDAGVVISQLATGRPTPVTAGVKLHQISLSMTAAGSYFQIVDFLRRLEDPRITARGFNVNTVSIAPGSYPTLNLTVIASLYASIDTYELPAPAPAPVPSAVPSESAAMQEVVS
jgi:Tfp pilus assembly protein PilO